MRVVDITNKSAANRITALSYGQSRAGKSRWAATWPRPLFLSDATESGWETVRSMNRNAWFEPDRAPIVWAIETASDMRQAIRDAKPLIQQGEVLTVVIDSLTFYADLFFNFLDSAGRVDQRQLYQKLGQHLKTIREEVHLLGCNVVWLALEKPPGEDTPVGGPMLSGSNAQKFAAGCDYVFYHRSFQVTPTAPAQWEIRTKRYQNYQAGGRDEGRLTDPLGYFAVGEDGNEIFMTDCNYRTVAECLGILEPGDGPEKLIAAMQTEQQLIAARHAVARSVTAVEPTTDTAPATSAPTPTNGKRPTPPQTR